MKVVKRDGTIVEFDKKKIKNAIVKAFIDVDGEETSVAKAKAAEIARYIESECNQRKDNLSVETIQDLVVGKLMSSSRKDVATKYVEYRYKRQLIRESNTTDQTIMELLNGTSEYWNTENSNKDAKVVTTQRDYIAGIASTDITRRFLLPKDIVDAHDRGVIHFHDADYFAQNALHNCFDGKTKFYTSDGIKKFSDFHDGDIVCVMDKNGVFRSATVRQYGKQQMFDITFKTSQREKTVTCTRNHRWLLKDGTVTTEIQVGDTLLGIQDSIHRIPDTYNECKMFAIGFLIGDGCDHISAHNHQIRLCGHKNEYVEIFKKAGYNIQMVSDSTDYIAYKNGTLKQSFIESKAWKYLNEEDKKFLFCGLYAADGAVASNKICTTDERVAELIEDTSYAAGYFITSRSIEVRDTNYKKDSKLICFRFSVSQPPNLCWKVSNIVPHFDVSNTSIEAWCVEEPVTHSFILDGGMITGNCDLINLDDMLQNGTVISGTLIEKPHSFSTACNIATQIIAQVASSQYGGQSVDMAALAPFVDISRQKIRKEVEEEAKYFAKGVQTYSGIDIDTVVEQRVKDEIKRGIQTIQYQVVTLMTTNGQTPFITVFLNVNGGKNKRERDDLALLIEETLNQRYEGTKNEQGVWVSPTFPKLIYVLDENNAYEGTEYWYLTKLAAKCSAKRLVPDYISAKIMRELKSGDVYTCMGKRKLSPCKIF